MFSPDESKPSRRSGFETAEPTFEARRLSAAPSLAQACFALLIALVAVGLIGPTGNDVQAQSTVINATYKKAANSELRVIRVFDGSMPSGMEPFQVRVRNRTKKPMRFNLTFTYGAAHNNERRYESTFTIVADAGGETIHQLLVPVAPTQNSSGYYYSNSQLLVTSPGQNNQSAGLSSQRSIVWPAVGISEKLGARNLSDLTTALENHPKSPSRHSNLPFGLKFEAEMLPTSWLGYSGLDVLMMTTDEWRSAAAASRQAILEWVRLGGRLSLYSDSNEKLSSLNLPAANRTFGNIGIIQWDGDKLPPEKTIEEFRKDNHRGKRLAGDFDSNWGVQTGFPSKSFNSLLIVILLIAFGVVVGPVNLFVLAKAGKRHRLFITTPLISIVASVLIAVLILFADGLGGNGTRLLFIDLEPDPAEKKAYVIQEQFSRAGVLLSSSFTIDDTNALISPVQLAATRWVQGNSGRHKFNGETYSGEWFLSRSEQAQMIESVRPSRSRIELRRPAQGDQPPELFSSVDFTLTSLHYLDDDGNAWKATAETVAAGQTIELEPVTRKDLSKWWQRSTTAFSSTNSTRIRKLTSRKGSFFALSEDSRFGAIDSLESIKWRNDRAVVFGTVLGNAAPPSAASPEDKADADADAE